MQATCKAAWAGGAWAWPRDERSADVSYYRAWNL